jgi:uncharacterized protein YfaS (alpha-2-macroglobulin family)
MATKKRKSQLYWYLSIFIFSSLVVTQLVSAQETASSNYSVHSGDKFFILSESAFTSTETATIRFDGPVSNEQSLEYDGVDIRIYKVAKPLEFLSVQKDLHRPTLKVSYEGEGLSNAFNYLWDKMFKISRIAFQNIFSAFIREKVVTHNAHLHQSLEKDQATYFKHNPQFKRVPGYEVVDEFRYPFREAKTSEPMNDVKMDGSSSEFSRPAGSHLIPLGKLKPGLYFIEALIGTFRASTVVFVSDTVAVTKTSSQQELVWTVDKKSGQVSKNSKIFITDGLGVKSKGETDSSGLFIFNRNARRSSEDSDVTYILGEDKNGGVFVSENFFYDSEFKDTKLFIFTDRSLYNPGDMVYGKIYGKLKPQTISVDIIDSSGNIVVIKKVNLQNSQLGGEFKLQLPASSIPGGYTIEAHYENRDYMAAFRVANYVKPPFDVSIMFGKSSGVAKEISGTIAIKYSNGSSIKDADVELEIKKQKLTIVAGDLQYLDRFPLAVKTEKLKSDDKGMVNFSLPVTKEPTRYVVVVKAKDKSAFRVVATKELLVNIVDNPLNLSTVLKYSKINEPVKILIDKKNVKNSGKNNWSWEAIRLQDQSTTTGKVSSSADNFSIKFEKTGNYTIILKNEDNEILSTITHSVVGQDMSLTAGTVNIIFDKEEYNVGEVANASMVFSEPIDEALITFEREKVEKAFLLSSSSPWYSLQKISDKEFALKIPIKDDFRPNIVLSAAFVKNGKYFFTNAGIKVAVSTVALDFQFDKKVYSPGETVNVTLMASRNSKPIETVVSVSVVDEMVYTLQPEITPDITQFFHHPLRNEVKTNASLNFHTYDSAVSATGSSPGQQNYERKLKLRERPRRDEKDTAYWGGALKTNKDGTVKFSFIMPDSLTRWRVQARAFDSEGFTGSRKDFIYSEKSFYIKWNAPKNYRVGDEAVVPLTVYNMTEVEKNVTLKLEGLVFDKKEINLKLSPGQNIVNLNLKGIKAESAKLSLWEGKSNIDQLEFNFSTKPVGWSTLETLKWHKGSKVPANATPVMLSISQGSGDAFFRATDYLVDYPYGCVEQTSSRLLPLALAYNGIKHFGQSLEVQDKIENVLLQERTRLVQLAGPDAKFSWWGNSSEASAFVTIYAYYSDYIASRSLELKLPITHWENTLKIYASHSSSESLHQRALEVWMIGQMGLPIKTLTEGVLKDIAGLTSLKLADPMSVGNNDVELATIYLVSKAIAADSKLLFPAASEQKLNVLLKNGNVSKTPIVGALMLLVKKELSNEDVLKSNEILNDLVQEDTTIQRALTLAFLYKKIGSKFSSVTIMNGYSPGKNWTKSQGDLSKKKWYWNGQKDVGELNIPANSSAHLIVEQAAVKKSSLPVVIKRSFYKLTKASDEEGYNAYLVESDKLDSTTLYLDEVTLTPNGKMNYGIVQIPLPPGGSVEKSSWGTQVRLNKNSVVIDEKGTQEGVDYYSAALPRLYGEVKVYQLIRFSMKGRFTIPGVRYFKMYAPEQQAYSNGDSISGQKITIN